MVEDKVDMVKDSMGLERHDHVIVQSVMVPKKNKNIDKSIIFLKNAIILREKILPPKNIYYTS